MQLSLFMNIHANFHAIHSYGLPNALVSSI